MWRKIVEFVSRPADKVGPRCRSDEAQPDRAEVRSGIHDNLVDEEALEFFNALNGSLQVEPSEPAQHIGTLLNVAAPSEGKVVSIRLTTVVFDENADEDRPLTEAELDMVVFQAQRIRLRGEAGQVVTHNAPDGALFTVRDLLVAIEETERRTRGATDWLGGVDVHHCFFEGIHRDQDGAWEISWGS